MTSAAQRTVRILIIGSKGVGKSALIYRFITKAPFDGSPVFDGHTTLRLDDETVRIEVVEWRENIPFDDDQCYFDAVAIVFSTTDVKSFHYAEQVHRYTMEQKVDIPVLLIESKVDEQNSDLRREEILDLVKRTQTKLYRVSVKDNFNITASFAYLVEKVLTQPPDQCACQFPKRNSLSDGSSDSIPSPGERVWKKIEEKGEERKKCTIM